MSSSTEKHNEATPKEETADAGIAAAATVTAKASAEPSTAGATAAAKTATTESAENNPDPELVEEEEVVEGDWARPQVELSEVDVKSGEEDEDVFWTHRAKLYRFAGEEWKERGLGDAKLLQHKQTGKVRFLLRQEKTLKLVANHYVIRIGNMCSLVPNSGNDKIWVWSTTDYAEGNAEREQFALKFGKVEDAAEFKKKFDEAAELNEKLKSKPAENK